MLHVNKYGGRSECKTQQAVNYCIHIADIMSDMPRKGKGIAHTPFSCQKLKYLCQNHINISVMNQSVIGFQAFPIPPPTYKTLEYMHDYVKFWHDGKLIHV